MGVRVLLIIHRISKPEPDVRWFLFTPEGWKGDGGHYTEQTRLAQGSSSCCTGLVRLD